jgi:histidinol-phosphate aminotransferase
VVRHNCGINDVTLSVPDYIEAIEPYQPGKPLEELAREYGIRDAVKLASNENPLGPSPKAIAAIRESLAQLHRYPDGRGAGLTAKLADKLGVDAHSIVLGNGSDDVIGMLTRALLRPGDESLMPRPSFLMYAIAVRSVGAAPVFVALNDKLAIDLEALRDRVTSRTRLVFLCNPNNPTGTVIGADALEAFLRDLPPTVTVVLDEAYVEFVRDPACASGLRHLNGDRPVVTLRTFSKAYGLAGLRIGYGVMPPDLANLLHRIRQPFNAGSLAQVGAAAALDDVAFLQKTIRLVHSGLDDLFARLARLGLRCFPTQSNFFLIDVLTDADAVFERLLSEGVIVRSMRSYGYPHYIRVNVGLPSENHRFITALGRVLKRVT